MSQPGAERGGDPTGLLETLLANTSDGVIVLDRDGRVALANPAAARIFGPALVGLSIARVLPPAATEQASAHMRLGLSDYLVRRTGLSGDRSLLLLQSGRRDDLALHERRHGQKLHDLLMTISSALSTPTILEQVARLTMELLGADASSIPLYDAEFDRISSGWIINLPLSSVTAPYTRSTGLVWDVIDNQTPILLNNYPASPRAMPSLVSAGVSAVAVVPIPGLERSVFGVIAVYQLAPDKGFTREDLEQLIVIGRQTGIAIQNARLYEDILREADRRHLLYLASVEIGAALDPEELYAAIYRAANRLMVCDSFALALCDEERAENHYVYIVDRQGHWPTRRVPLGRGLLGHVIDSDISLRLCNSDSEIEQLFGAERLHASADVTRSILAVVMHTGQQIVGAMTVQAYAPEAYTSKELDALEMLASTAAIACQNARLFAQVQELATIDALTQVPNRRHFFELATRELERSQRYRHPVSLIMFDIDSFKQVNDSYGHLAGDQVLKMIAARARDGLRDVDTVARFGGEEFVALLPETDYERALQVAQRLCSYASERPVETDAGPLAVTISVGVDSSDAVFAGTLSDLIDRADQALYAAKNSGRNRAIGFRGLVFGRDGSTQASAGKAPSHP